MFENVKQWAAATLFTLTAATGMAATGPIEVVQDRFVYKDGEWGPGFNAQNEMLDEYSEKFGLDKLDWRKQKPWYKPGE